MAHVISPIPEEVLIDGKLSENESLEISRSPKGVSWDSLTGSVPTFFTLILHTLESRVFLKLVTIIPLFTKLFKGVNLTKFFMGVSNAHFTKTSEEEFKGMKVEMQLLRRIVLVF